MTKAHGGIQRSEDIRLYQATACSSVHDCATCEYAKECQQEDNKYVERTYNKMFQGERPAKGHVLGSPPRKVV
jgi:hypothetical protein